MTPKNYRPARPRRIYPPCTLGSFTARPALAGPRTASEDPRTGVVSVDPMQSREQLRREARTYNAAALGVSLGYYRSGETGRFIADGLLSAQEAL